jgi:hypothetical protein
MLKWDQSKNRKILSHTSLLSSMNCLYDRHTVNFLTALQHVCKYLL